MEQHVKAVFLSWAVKTHNPLHFTQGCSLQGPNEGKTMDSGRISNRSGTEGQDETVAHTSSARSKKSRPQHSQSRKLSVHTVQRSPSVTGKARTETKKHGHGK